MGWCSGTDHFDKALELMYKYVPEEKKAEVLRDWYNHLSDYDADCLDESDFHEELKKYGISEWDDDE